VTRLRLSMRDLRVLNPSACDTDARVLLHVETGQLSLRADTNSGVAVECELPKLSGTRELRLLAKQLEAFADLLDHAGPSFEEIP